MDLEPIKILQGGYLLAVLYALTYGLYYVRRAQSFARSLVKTASIGTLALVSLYLGGPAILTMALVLSALGDAFLSRDGERDFLYGLISFLLAHIAYIGLFWGAGPGMSGFSAHLWLITVGVVIFLSALDTLRRLWPNLRRFRWPVVIYTGAICLMGLAALTVPRPMVLAGALMFMMSDTILAHEEFYWAKKHHIRSYSPYAVWALYFVGQALIAWPFLA